MTELQSASGLGAEYFTDRAVFFLQHRAQIYEWFGLRYDAMQSINRILESLAEPISEVAADWVPWDGTIGKYRCLFLVPPGVDATDFPWTGVALGWVPQGVMPDIKTQAPWIGIYGYPEHESTPGLHAGLDGADRGSSGYESSKPWPRFRWLPAEGGWWTDLDSYRSELLHEFTALLTRYKDAIEKCV